MGVAKSLNNERGAALVIALMFLAILTLLGGTAAVLTTTDIQIGRNYKASSSAFNNAEAGLNFALASIKAGLKANPQTFQLPTVVWDPDNPTNTSSFSSMASFTAPTGFSFSYETPGVTMDANANFTYTTTGADPNDAQSKSVIKVTFTPTGLFNYGIFGDLGVTLSGNGKTDSYNSSSAPYTWATHNTEGDVGTNAITAGAITLSGNAKVYGDAMVGAGGNPATGVSTSGNAAVVSPGQKLAADETKDMTPLSDPGGGTNLPAWNLSANNNDTLSTGTYRLPGITFSGNATGTINGNVTLYVTGNISISGNASMDIASGGSLTIYASGSVSITGNGISNNTSYPGNLQIYGTSTCSSISVSGNGDLYGAIYAPRATVSVTGNGDIFGSVIGRTINISGNGDIHYDEALQNVGPVSTLKLLHWEQKL